jgi:hypothetical protein
MSAENKCKICSHHGRIHLNEIQNKVSEREDASCFVQATKTGKDRKQKNDIKKILKREMISRKPHIDKSIRKE